MSTKKLLLTAAIGAAVSTGAIAQNEVYSQNVVGYVNKTFPVGFTMVANPLDAANNTLAGLFPDVPNFSNFYKWNGTGFDIATFAFGTWDMPNLTLAPGEGAFINTGSEFTVTFVGEVRQGELSQSIPLGFSIQASQVPQAGGVQSALGLTLGNFDNLYQWNGTGYNIFTVTFGSWDPSEPQISVGESFFVNAQSPTTWNRTFSVN